MEETILSAAFEVVDRETLAGTRMRLIAEEAGVVQSNLHYYFKTKRDLLLALLRYIQKNFSEKRDAVLAQRSNDLKDKLSGFFEQKKQIIQDEPQYDRTQFDYWCMGRVDPEINEEFYQSYQIWRKHIAETVRLYDPAVEPEEADLLAHVMVSMMMGESLQVLNSKLTVDLELYATLCCDMLMEYLRPTPSSVQTS
ncbi:MAG: TetR/AcrR family transcriptional regulator [Clostridiales bacterium]|uniref:TetR/AcrR family transcriptional regulator n=1 Tax=Flavonifractor porci TaxID=3133422 RepID=UPI0030B52364|nr:TetR/AcrR family transcriptional regulator [Clostridiales bacterium]